MPDNISADDISADAIHEKTRAFLSLDWVSAMYAYTQTVTQMNAPAPPPDQEGMITEIRAGQPILSLPALMERARANAGRWEPMIGEMHDVARAITAYAESAILTVEQIARRTKAELAPAAWAKLTPEERKELADEFDEMVSDLQNTADSNGREALRIRDAILAYRRDIREDRDASGDIQVKYKDWLAEQDKTIHVWEEQHGLKPGETEELINKLQEDVDNFNKKWIGLTSGATGAAGGTVAFGLVIFPPFGAIAGLIAMSVMASQAAQAKRDMEEFQGRLDRAKKFNEVKVFFSIINSKLEGMMKAIGKAADALGTIAGKWSLIAADLKTVREGSMVGLGGLAGSKPWEAPVMLVRKLGVVGSYKKLIGHCEVFILDAYDDAPKTIKAGSHA